ncbi:CYTH domain-containing protein [Lederbergia lenta]|uniref:Cytosolic protein n=1 Tax=Lederbergia lenta TaxID=1467 RepID=A0A2X4W9J2_LEDLE|nr:CYTH domain-containing protein [Lederbergia lenta]MEC2323989.1 CYTH domain-containing protein [Lederbergia lenta]SQI60866.1 cytosolic protein [Lederbergia lenta]
MTKNIEIEFKNIVSETDFHLITQTFQIKNDQFFTQTNHYFDTSDFSLKQAGAALRVRELPLSFEFTLKMPAKIGLLEVNQNLSNEEASLLRTSSQIPNGEVMIELIKMNINMEDIQYFGSLTTNRAEIKYKDGLLVFDHSFYLNKEDFEIEYEVADWSKGKINFEQLMSELNIPILSADNKIERFYSAKKMSTTKVID